PLVVELGDFVLFAIAHFGPLARARARSGRALLLALEVGVARLRLLLHVLVLVAEKARIGVVGLVLVVVLFDHLAVVVRGLDRLGRWGRRWYGRYFGALFGRLVFRGKRRRGRGLYRLRVGRQLDIGRRQVGLVELGLTRLHIFDVDLVGCFARV